MRWYTWKQNNEDLGLDMKNVEKKVKEIESRQAERTKKYIPPPRKFNPNEYELQDWINLGLSEKQAQVIINFKQRENIQNNEHLRQIFVINDEFYELIRDSTYYEVADKK